TLPVKNTHAMRIGFNYVRDLGEDGRKAIVAERVNGGAYTSFDNFIDRLRGRPIGPRAVRNLVMVGAFDGLGHTRRELLWGWQERWHGHGLRKGIQSQSELKLKAAAPNLPELDDFDINQLEYRISDLSTGHHLIHFCRDRLKQLGALESNKLPSIPSGRRVRVAGLVITRQAPSTAKKIRFFTLEDEFGQVNVTIKPDVYDRYRQDANRPQVLVIDGVARDLIKHQHDQPPVRDLNRDVDRKLTFADRVASDFARLIGSWIFVLAQVGLMLLWVLLNAIGLLRHWDPYPFLFLNFVFSLEAAIWVSVVLMTLNSMADRDRMRAQNEYELNVKAEEELTALMNHLMHKAKIMLKTVNRLD